MAKLFLPKGLIKSPAQLGSITLLQPVVTLLSVLALIGTVIASDKPTELSMEDFLRRAAQNDVQFELILLEQLPLQYRRDALLANNDLIVQLKQQFHIYLSENHQDAQSHISLQQLFPNSGTEWSLAYDKTAATTNNDNASLELLVSQPIAKNAFGKSFQLKHQILGIEDDIIRHQIIEAYEDYLAALMVTYNNWYSAYENLKTGQASLRSTNKLLDNIKERRRQKIALPIDVNKMKLSLAGKEENLILLQESYNSYTTLINRALGEENGRVYIPQAPRTPVQALEFERDYQQFTQESRTYNTLKLLEQKSSLQVKTAADELLPSSNLLFGYQLHGEQWGSSQREDNVFAGISFSMPLGNTLAKARHGLSKIEYRKTRLSNKNKYQELHSNLKRLYLRIEREQQLMSLAKRKIDLSAAILRDEEENYSFGKVSLNDYIDAVNTADANRFGYTAHRVQLNILHLEWLRLTDRLVDEPRLAEPERSFATPQSPTSN